MDVLVMAKAPVPGRVKTRLCPPCAPAEAAALAEAALADTLEAVAACGADRRVLALDGEAGAWLPSGFVVVPQRGPTFGARLARAWDDVGRAALQIGMDTPHVTPAQLDDALGQVRPGRAVLGPATDGGWWALGLARPDRRVFDGVPMSTPETGARQRDRLTMLGYRVDLLATLTDIDHVDDALAVAAEIPESRTAEVVGRLAAPIR